MGRRGVCATLVAVVAVSGCGSAGAPVIRPRLTEEQFVSRANLICKRYSKKFKAFGKQVSVLAKRRKFEALVLVLGELRRPFRKMLFQLSTLQAPRRDEAGFRRLISAGNKELTYLNGLYHLLSTYDFQEARVVVRRLNRNSRQIHPLARSLGLPFCARAL